MDRDPPVITWVSPPPDSTMIPLDTEIEILFSEGMDRESVEQSVFISPIPEVEPRFSWHKQRLWISLPGGLKPDQTYVVTVGTGAKDRHGNSMESSFTFAFSTGYKLDRGKITGKALYGGKGAAGAYLWAYNLEDTPTPNPEIDPPDYITQADGEGNYCLSYLGWGTYRLFAFVDRYRDGVYDVGEDPLAVPPHDVALTKSKTVAVAGNLILAVRDTTAPQLITARPQDNVHLLLRFNKPIQPPLTGRNFRIAPVVTWGDEELGVPLAYLDPKEHTKCHLVTEPQELGREYSVTVVGVKDEAGNKINPRANTATFFGSGEPDTTCPRVLSTSPEDSATGVPLDQGVEITFNEAMARHSVERGFSLMDTRNRRVTGKVYWPDPTVFRFVPRQKLSGSSAYVAQLDPKVATDIAGNPLADSLVVVFFTTLNPDTLGAISGTVFDRMVGDERGKIYIKAHLVGKSGLVYRTHLKNPGPYRFPAVLPGNYWISAFRDRDGNGRFSYGRAFPFIPAESFAIYPDTVWVRSRWETKGINLYFE